MSLPTRLLLAPLPALSGGIVVMLLHGGAYGRVAVNVAAGMVGSLAVVAASRRRRSPRRSDVAWPIAAAGALCLIGSTLAMPGEDGVHRWLEIGPVRLHASLLVTPLVIAAAYVLGRRGYWRAAAAVVAAVQVLHVLQPDAAQATGVAAAVGVLAWAMRHESDSRPLPAAAVGVAGASFAWMVADPLGGVADVEGVFGTAFDQHPALGAAAIAAAATLTAPFTLGRRGCQRRGHASTPTAPTPIARAMGAYVAGVLLATQVGEFPVLVLGHGASTVLGYYSAAVALLLADHRSIGSPSEEEAVEQPTGQHNSAGPSRDQAARRPVERRAADGVSVVGRGLTKRYGAENSRVTVLDSVDIEVRPAEFVSVMGPSGSGKSTLLHLLAGLDVPDSGTVTVSGVSLGALDDDERARLRQERIGIVFQFPSLVPVLTAAENIALPGVIVGRKQSSSARRVAELLELVGLQGHAHKLPSQLAGGQQQRIALARALFAQPALLLADEPTGNLDTETGSEILTVLARARSELGQSILMVTHDPHAAARGDRTLLLCHGRIAGELQFHESSDEPERVNAVLELQARSRRPTSLGRVAAEDAADAETPRVRARRRRRPVDGPTFRVEGPGH